MIEDIYIWFIVVLRVLDVVLGSAVAGMLFNYWLVHSDTLTKAQKQGIVVIGLGALNAVIFTMLVLFNTRPTWPGSMVALGYLLFLVGTITLFFNPENRQMGRA